MRPRKPTTPSRSSDEIGELTRAVEQMHGSPARFVRSTPVDERHHGTPVWRGTVAEFALASHPRAKRCFAWGPPQPAGKIRYYAVLGIPPIDTAVDAVRASIVADAKRSAN